MYRVALPEFKPDQSVNSGVLLRCENVYPAIDGYRPVGTISTISDSLDESFLGGASAIASDGTAYLLAGTATDLYRYSVSGFTSLISGLTITKRWRFAQFGQFALAVNGGATQEVNLLAGTAGVLAAAPTGTSIAVIGDHVVIGQPDGDISSVQWSAFNDHTAWTIGTNQAGIQPMNTGGVVQAIVGGEYGIILQRERIVRMTLTGDSTAPFQFDEISSNFGCAASATVAQAGRTIFFRSDRGFMALDDGQTLKAIGSEKVDRTFEAEVSRDDLESIYTAIDPQNKLVVWGVPGTPGTVWIYNFELDRWATARFSFTGIFPGFSTSFGVDDLEAEYGGTDDTAFTTDDPRWTGGNPRLYFVSSDRKIGTLAGDNLAARFDMGFTQFSPGRRARVRGLRLVSDIIDGVTATLDARARLGDVVANTSTTTLRASGLLPVRAAGRFISTSLVFEAGAVWDFVQGIEIDFAPGGER